MRTTAPIAFDPYSALCGPRTTSIRSMFVGERWARSKPPPNAFSWMPSTKHERVVRFAAAREDAGQRARAARLRNAQTRAPAAAHRRPSSPAAPAARRAEMTVTDEAQRESGISTCAADTTSVSETALICERHRPDVRAAAARAVDRRCSARKPRPPRAARTVPASGVASVNSPLARRLRCCARRAVADEQHLRAGATGRPSGSTMRPVDGPRVTRPPRSGNGETW